MEADLARRVEDPGGTPDPPPRTVVIPVRYGGVDGPDLQEVARETGLSPDDVVRRHAEALYEVVFLGFTPGFPYLAGLPAELATRRRVPQPPAGALDPELPSWSRVYRPQTPLQPETVADTFVHPHGFCRNVLSTGVVTRRGTAALAGGRETMLLRCDHPRTSHLLNDRPDHWRGRLAR